MDSKRSPVMGGLQYIRDIQRYTMSWRVTGYRFGSQEIQPVWRALQLIMDVRRHQSWRVTVIMDSQRTPVLEGYR
ncbi:unnamed protein product [Coregonus sp. 'balchen']|nr:unnamed protein product [Coregonus sp. 'balchen']